jgi:threonine dehydrogenase-like Zn-dependent dehydrogenase
LKYYGYTNLLATASLHHHEYLKSLGAREVFDYRQHDAPARILAAAGSAGVPFILDCIGSKNGSLAPLAKIAGKGSRVAVLLPVIVKDSTETEAPEYTMDAGASAPWKEGVDARGVRTHFYLEVSLSIFYKFCLSIRAETGKNTS